MCWRNFCNFPLVTKNVKSRSKIALFSNERHFEIWFPKKRTITFFWSKLSILHKKDTILHMATTFSLKQGKTRTSHGPIPHPLKCVLWLKINLLCCTNYLKAVNDLLMHRFAQIKHAGHIHFPIWQKSNQHYIFKQILFCSRKFLINQWTMNIWIACMKWIYILPIGIKLRDATK